MKTASLWGISSIAVSVCIALMGCGGGSDNDAATTTDPGPKLTALEMQEISNTSILEPQFSPDVRNYTYRVPADAYGVLMQPAGASTLTMKVTASTTAGAYSPTAAKTDTDTPETVPYSNANGPNGYTVKLSQSYAAYDVEYVQTATIDLSDSATGKTSSYVVKIVRDNDTAIYNKFGAEKIFTAQSGTALKYRIYYPPNYQASSKKYPVVLALHGNGQKASTGSPSDMVLKRNKIATTWAQDSEKDVTKEAIVIAPQASGASTLLWTAGDDAGNLSADGQAAYELLLQTIATEKADANRVYLVGLSMGGNGTLTIAAKYPQTFAAIWACAGWLGMPSTTVLMGDGFNWAGVKQYLDKKIWLVQAVDDPQVKFALYNNVIRHLADNGISFGATIFPSGTFFWPDAHWSWSPGLADESVKEWLFRQSKQ